LARKPSVRRNTGVIYVTAIRMASKAAKKQSEGVDAAMTGTGASP
jgi:hypothetical protein